MYLDLAPEEILAIPLTKPEKIFSRQNWKEESRKLLSKWHPDRNHHPKAEELVQHLLKLKECAEDHADSDKWDGPAEYFFMDDKGKVYKFKYRKMFEFEIGKCFISKSKVLYLILNDNKEFFQNALNRLRNISFKDKKYEEQFSKYFPRNVQTFTSDEGLIILFDRPNDTVLIQDLLDYLPDHKIPPKHVAWIVSSMMNNCIFLEKVLKVSHCGISETNIFISPSKHYSFVAGGWWYSVLTGHKMIGLAGELMMFFSKTSLASKTSESINDRLLLRRMAIRCLGDDSGIGSKLLMDADIPRPIINWLRGTPNECAVKDYQSWFSVLEAAYGKRTFVNFDVNINEIY